MSKQGYVLHIAELFVEDKDIATMYWFPDGGCEIFGTSQPLVAILRQVAEEGLTEWVDLETNPYQRTTYLDEDVFLERLAVWCSAQMPFSVWISPIG